MTDRENKTGKEEERERERNGTCNKDQVQTDWGNLRELLSGGGEGHKYN
jgi:hypothetical protein